MKRAFHWLNIQPSLLEFIARVIPILLPYYCWLSHVYLFLSGKWSSSAPGMEICSVNGQKETFIRASWRPSREITTAFDFLSWSVFAVFICWKKEWIQNSTSGSSIKVENQHQQHLQHSPSLFWRSNMQTSRLDVLQKVHDDSFKVNQWQDDQWCAAKYDSIDWSPGRIPGLKRTTKGRRK